jgi:uncharacterized RDD family membrane protein YckC
MENAGLLRRLGAILYDTLLLLALLFMATIPFIALRGGEAVAPETPSYQLAMVAVAYLFFVGFWTRVGSTLGMRSWRLRVEAEGQRLPTVGEASIRFAVAILSWLCLGLGFLWQLWDRDGLTWHDRASGTRLRYYPRKKDAQS